MGWLVRLRSRVRGSLNFCPLRDSFVDMIGRQLLCRWFPELLPVLSQTPTVRELSWHLADFTPHALVSAITGKIVDSEGIGRKQVTLHDAVRRAA